MSFFYIRSGEKTVYDVKYILLSGLSIAGKMSSKMIYENFRLTLVSDAKAYFGSFNQWSR